MSISFFNQQHISNNNAIHLSILEEKKITLCIKREDEIHPHVSGNKFRKLKYNLKHAKELGKTTLLTFGGAFSNHILATAVAGNITGFKTIGIIRGDELGKDLNKTLQQNSTLRLAYENGMIFYFVDRTTYRNKNEISFQENLKNKFGDFYIIPEGGTNELAIKGCEEILVDKDSEFDYICSAIGTGGTISGLINASKEYQKVLGFPSLKGDFLKDEIQKFTQKTNWELITNYHFGGYAKYNDDLIRFMNKFFAETNILLDPVYTAKMLFGILDMVSKDYFENGSKIVAIHTGGLQGISGFNDKLKSKNKESIHTL